MAPPSATLSASLMNLILELIFQESSAQLAMGAAFGVTPPIETVLTLSFFLSIMDEQIKRQELFEIGMTL